MSKLTPDDNYITYAWMTDELQLEGPELTIYAIIYKYSSNPEVGCYYGSQQYLCDWTKKTKPTIQKALNSLVDKQLILKEEIWENGVKFCKYRVNRDVIELGWGYLNNFNTPKETLINIYTNINKDNNTNNTIDLKNLNTPQEVKPNNEIEELFDKYTVNDDLYNALLDFADYRKEKKNPLTLKAAKLLLGKLDKCSTDKDRIDCLQTSIMNGWTGVFPQDTKKPNVTYHHDNADTTSTDRKMNGRKN